MAMVSLSERSINCLTSKPEIPKESNFQINNEINKSHIEKEKKEESLPKQQKYSNDTRSRNI